MMGASDAASHATMTAAHEPGQPATRLILLVEDNDADAELAREALAGGVLGSELYVVRDGALALRFLAEGARGERRLPDIVILDLNLPGLDGRAVLAELREHPVLRAVPVIVMSSSSAPADVRDVYSLSANCYVTKPMSLAQYLATIRAIERYWMTVATLPCAAG